MTNHSPSYPHSISSPGSPTSVLELFPMEKRASLFASKSIASFRKSRKRPIHGNDSNASTTATTAKSPKRVHFHHRIKARLTLSRRDMTTQERRDYWFQEDEFRAIYRRNESAIESIERSFENNLFDRNVNNSNSSSNNNKSSSSKSNVKQPVCLRGLETQAAYMTSEACRVASTDAVFLEQKRQHDQGIYDDEAIAEVYQKLTMKCQICAHNEAILDRKEVGDDCCDPTDYSDKDSESGDELHLSTPKTTKKKRKPFATVRSWVAKHARKAE